MTQLLSPPTRPRTRRLNRKLLVIVGVLVIVAGAAIWGGTAWWQAHQAAAKAAADAAAGAAALVDGQRDVDVMNTMDFHNVDVNFQAWLNVSTGALHNQLTQAESGLKQQFATNQVVTSGRITRVRVVSPDAAAGTATILGTEDVQLTTGKSTVTQHNGFHANLSRTPAGWRLTSYATDTIPGA
jgi:Mce-associated membrane protein